MPKSEIRASCCGYKTTGIYCAHCGKKLDEMSDIRQLLSNCLATARNYRVAAEKYRKDQAQQAAAGKSVSSDFYAARVEQNTRLAEKWERWSNALKQLMEGAGDAP